MLYSLRIGLMGCYLAHCEMHLIPVGRSAGFTNEGEEVIRKEPRHLIVIQQTPPFGMLPKR